MSRGGIMECWPGLGVGRVFIRGDAGATGDTAGTHPTLCLFAACRTPRSVAGGFPNNSRIPTAAPRDTMTDHPAEMSVPWHTNHSSTRTGPLEWGVFARLI